MSAGVSSPIAMAVSPKRNPVEACCRRMRSASWIDSRPASTSTAPIDLSLVLCALRLAAVTTTPGSFMSMAWLPFCPASPTPLGARTLPLKSNARAAQQAAAWGLGSRDHCEHLHAKHLAQVVLRADTPTLEFLDQGRSDSEQTAEEHRQDRVENQLWKGMLDRRLCGREHDD